MQDFWRNSGYQHLQRNDHGWLRVTPDYVRFLLERPELAPIAESGPGERALYARLMDDPLQEITSEALAQIEDTDTRENYLHFLRVRQGMRDAVTLECYYQQLFRRGAIDIPPLFIDLIAQAILRGMLDGVDDSFVLRAAEMLFRRQRVSTEGGQILAADAETIQHFADSGGFGDIGRLIAQQGTPLRQMRMDVLSHENAPLYWLQDNRHTYLLDLTHGRQGLDALANVLARWVVHFTGAEVRVEPQQAVADTSWRWHVGLDIDSSAILNDLYEGNEVDQARLSRLISLFRVDFLDATDVRDDVAGAPVYLGLAHTQDNQLKLKPQNLLLNLPFASQAS